MAITGESQIAGVETRDRSGRRRINSRNQQYEMSASPSDRGCLSISREHGEDHHWLTVCSRQGVEAEGAELWMKCGVETQGLGVPPRIWAQIRSSTTPWSVRLGKLPSIGSDTPDLSSATSTPSILARAFSFLVVEDSSWQVDSNCKQGEDSSSFCRLGAGWNLSHIHRVRHSACPAGTPGSLSWRQQERPTVGCWRTRMRGVSGTLPPLACLAVACRRRKVATGLVAVDQPPACRCSPAGSNPYALLG
ncbi:hypothetical protein B0T14DRAFT_279368 [Immersiella caudata]|uniref:Uncharacterized protein n=1 Tax=Immersiella caudata TaxID=314043 RepID=A0AA40BTV2_9PEZI|nr:hypothetical protein B0T14DRAFT_279368 [Immersiella caudata]